MKMALLVSLSLAAAAYAGDTNNPARLLKGETWYSTSRLDRIAKDYAKQQKIEFRFEKTYRNVSIEKHGTNAIATIWYSSGMGKPVFGVEVAPSGTVITNYVGIAICGTGRTP